MNSCPVCGSAFQEEWETCPVCGFKPNKAHTKSVAIRDKILSIMSEQSLDEIILERKYLVEFVESRFIELDKLGRPKLVDGLSQYLREECIEVQYEEEIIKFIKISEERSKEMANEDGIQRLHDIVDKIMQMVLKIPELVDKSISSINERLAKLEKTIYVDILGGNKEDLESLPPSIRGKIMSELKDLFSKRKKNKEGARRD